MSMTQQVLGAALGFIIAQVALSGLGHAIRGLPGGGIVGWVRALTAPPGTAILGGLIRYAGVIAVSAALLTLGVWAVGDYLKAGSARNASIASTDDSSSTAPAPDSRGTPAGATRVAAALPAEPADADADADAVAGVDPYADPDFKVQHQPRRAGAALSLKETLLQRSEATARAELLTQTHQHVLRSQYDCEEADRADKYLKAGLDVWGFESWQLKYFPLSSYRGATLAQCRAIKNVVDPRALDLRATVAQENHPRPAH
jgi:hypothetical protein